MGSNLRLHTRSVSGEQRHKLKSGGIDVEIQHDPAQGMHMMTNAGELELNGMPYPHSCVATLHARVSLMD